MVQAWCVFVASVECGNATSADDADGSGDAAHGLLVSACERDAYSAYLVSNGQL
ncbi:Hypothetical protein, putative [Bodo saltans]|uniref:Uncharacterized protein n=1 Tax=Bodo saltans TaxID=75058 RepID=A0A0S4J389_BODSA|nr:Hypothetical protein, putative [Bodo saltans]|eukprot:CUG68610.1 Hypothetical protein, putative [Bodo saltans]